MKPGQGRRLGVVPSQNREDRPEGVPTPAEGARSCHSGLSLRKRRPERGPPLHQVHGREVSGAAGVRVHDKRGSVWRLKPPGHDARHGSSTGPQKVAAAVQGLQQAAAQRYNASR